MDVTVVIDCCYSGSFLGELTNSGPAKRIVIAACAADEPAYFLADGLVSFSDAFWSGALQGLNLNDCFQLAANAVGIYQQALLDDTGDGLFHQGVDGQDATLVSVGASTVAGVDIPQIGRISENQTLTSTSVSTLWAADVSGPAAIERVWCVIVPPGFDPDPSQPVQDVPQVELLFNSLNRRYEGTYDGFIQAGTYKLIYYARDVRQSVSLPRQAFITQTGFDERAIVVVAGNTNETSWASFNALERYAWHTLRLRRLPADHLKVLSTVELEDLDDGTNNVAGLPSLESLGFAITNWADTADKLTVYCLGATTNGHFQLNPEQTLTATQLDLWIDHFQVSNRSVNVMLDFDGSGDYVKDLAAPSGRERIVIASTASGSPSIFGAAGLISFSQFFLNSILNGHSLGTAFTSARDAVRFASGQVRQAAQLDDNGDGIANQKGSDGRLAPHRYLGAAFVTGDDLPLISEVMPDQTVVAGMPVELWASGVVGGSNVWCVITPPDYDGQGELPQITLTWNSPANRFQVAYANFTMPGTYACTFFASNQTGLVSGPAQSAITVTDAYEVDDSASQARVINVNETQRHNFHSSTDEDWVKFYAPTGWIFNLDATQRGTNSDLVLDLYYEHSNGRLVWVDSMDDPLGGTGSNITERLIVDLKTGQSGFLPGMYYLRISSYSPDLHGPGSEYDLQVYVPVGGSGGVIRLGDGVSIPFPVECDYYPMGGFYVFVSPPEAVAAGAGWRITEDSNQTYFSDTVTYGLPAVGANYHLAFRTIPGYLAPAERPLTITCNHITSVLEYYTYTGLSPRAVDLNTTNSGVFITYLGSAGQRYALEKSTNLLHWVSGSTNIVPQDGWLRFVITNAPDKAGAFYRARLIP